MANCNNNASGDCASAQGMLTNATGMASHAEGYESSAEAAVSHAEGHKTASRGTASHSEGYLTISTAYAAHAEGYQTTASGEASHAEGGASSASGIYAHSEGGGSIASGLYAHSEGGGSIASGDVSHAEGYDTVASGEATHAEGGGTRASGPASHAQGVLTSSSGRGSHAEGESTIASGHASHAEGLSTRAVGLGSHSEGAYTISDVSYSHAEGYSTRAGGYGSHSEGAYTSSDADHSHAEGIGTHTLTFEGAHIMGRYGAADTAYSWFLANGTDDANRSLAAKILNDGNMFIDGTYGTPAADYAELFETVDLLPIEPGFFVTLEGRKIRKSSAPEQFVLGVTSGTPGVLGNSGELHWQDKYLRDEWGRIMYHEVQVEAILSPSGEAIQSARLERQPVLNPNWDSSQIYIPRTQRPEWVAVGLLGQLLVRDTGTCSPGGYCLPNESGIAAPASEGYRVLERTGPNQILILFR